MITKLFNSIEYLLSYVINIYIFFIYNYVTITIPIILNRCPNEMGTDFFREVEDTNKILTQFSKETYNLSWTLKT